MKYVKLEYPDKSIHNIIINNFYYNKEEDSYLINFYDMSESQRLYSILKENANSLNATKIIKEVDINKLEEKNFSLLPKIIKYEHKKEDINTFTVYKTKYSLFTNENLCNYYKIAKNSTKRKIKGIDCLEITKNDLNEIIEKSQSDVNFISVYCPKISRIYNCYKYKNKLYVTRNIYEVIQKYELEIEANPKIIDSRNCYSITKEQLDNFNKKYHYQAQEIEFKENSTIIYKDKNTNKLYLPLQTDYLHYDTIILNKKCQEITSYELANLTNPIIVSVYTNSTSKITREIIICSYEDKIYILKNLTEEFKEQPKKTEKIKINNELYLKISADYLDYLKKEAFKKNIILKFNIKRIVPKVKKIN